LEKDSTKNWFQASEINKKKLGDLLMVLLVLKAIVELTNEKEVLYHRQHTNQLERSR
jgi:hypothetical protein